jgi:hypothetical protein
LYVSGDAAEALTELCGGFAMAWNAEGADVIQITLASAFYDGEDVVGVPEGAAAGDGFHAIKGESGDTGFAAGALERGVDGDGVGTAEVADAVVASEDLVAEVAGVGAEAPLVDTEVGTEGAAALGEDLKLAPAAERAAVFTVGQDVRADASAWEGAGDHDTLEDRVFSSAAGVAEA